MEVFSGLALVLGVAAIGGIAAKALRQPALIGYVLAGGLLSLFGVLKWEQMDFLVKTMGSLGVTLLLFLAGLELPLAELKRTGKASLLSGVLQIILSSAGGFALARILGFAWQDAIYVGLGLAFGSTILVVKLLSEKGDIQSLSGKLAVGILLVQDFVAIGLLVVLSGTGGGKMDPVNLVFLLLKAVLLIGVAVWLSERVAKISGLLGKSTELLFISSIGWCLAVAAVVSSPWFGFSAEIGGFIAGLALAGASEQGQIISRVRPLRDFFLTWYFVALGADIGWSQLAFVLPKGLALSAFVLVINPLILALLLGALGYKRRTFFVTGVTLSQISEFSLILANRAVYSGQASTEVLSVLTIVAVVTMTVSTYLISNVDRMYRKWGAKLAALFERKTALQQEVEEKLSGHVILFGHNRIGRVLLPVLRNQNEVVVVDFNPEVVEKLERENVRAIYGDMSDHELYERVDMQDSELVISTVPDVNDSLQFLSEIKSWNRKPTVVLTANDSETAERLYGKGADYVLVPHSLGGHWLAHVISHQGMGRAMFHKFAGERENGTGGK